MFDLKGSNDLELDSNGDLILEKTPGSLFRKAVLSPKGYLSYEYNANEFIDLLFGNDVYFKIKENINTDVISSLNDDIKDATSFVNIPINNVQASIDSLSTINYLITYSDNTTQEITINV